MENIKRRAFLEHVSRAGLLGIFPAGSFAGNSDTTAARDHSFLTEPYLQNLSTDTVNIMWVCSQNSFSWAELYEEGRPVRKVFREKHGLIKANNRINNIRVDGLKPGTAYQYKVVSTEIEVFEPYSVTFGETIDLGPYSFSTLSGREQGVRFAVFNDIHEQAGNIPELLGKHAPERDYDLVFYNGDSFNWVDDEQMIIDKLLKPSAEVFATTCPFVMVQGNHEPRGKFARRMFDYFNYPQGHCYYAFTQGPVRFVVLDSGEDKGDGDEEYSGMVAFDRYREQQARWLEKEIASSDFRDAAFRVVLIHISPWHSGERHGTLHCREVFGPLLNKGRVDLQLSGHTHRYKTHDADAMHKFPIVIGGGPGFEGRGGGTRTLIKVKADRKTLRLQMLVDDGTVVGAYELKK